MPTCVAPLPATSAQAMGGSTSTPRNTRPEAVGTDEIKWNFTKFLIDRDGNVVRRYEPSVTPEEIRADLDEYLDVTAR